LTVSCNANPTQGNAPLQTTFTANVNGGSGSYSNYHWDFKDGSSQNTNNNYIQHTYNNPGQYNTVITVTDSNNNQATATCQTVNVLPPIAQLQVSCAASPRQGYAPLLANFVATASGGSGVYNNYHWDFDDGTIQNGFMNFAFHTYNNAGTYDTIVTVTDSNNNQATTTCPSVHVLPPIQPLTVTCGANPTSGIAPLNVNFNAQVSGGSGYYTNYGWVFDDGNSQNTQSMCNTHIRTLESSIPG
jgi:PKD repeat protein